MADPLASITPGKVSPFVKSAATINTVLDIARLHRQQMGGQTGGNAGGLDPLTPWVRVWIKNDTGDDLDPFSIVALGEPTADITDEDLVHEFFSEPIFPGTEPAATSDIFAILEQPAPDGLLARAIVLGMTRATIEVTDTAHMFAVPTVSDSTKLTSAASGPARVIWKESGTGTKKAAVFLTGQGGGSLPTVYGQPSTSATAGLTAIIPALTNLPRATYHVTVTLSVNYGSGAAITHFGIGMKNHSATPASPKIPSTPARNDGLAGGNNIITITQVMTPGQYDDDGSTATVDITAYFKQTTGAGTIMSVVEWAAIRLS